ncbi:MAG: lipopolysaccharide kinase InaA family protein [Nitrospirota bacterium]|nr:lipopolysaccharide kinase InaA family protein [Nitrospirota bacterium]
MTTMSGACRDSACETMLKVNRLIEQYPGLLEPVRVADRLAEKFVAANDLVLYPTVRTTTLLYDRHADLFLKILHPVNLKSRVLFMARNRAQQIWQLSEELNAEGIAVPGVLAYGRIRRGKRPVFVMKKIRGMSLYDILIREKKTIPFDLRHAVIDRIAALHKAGFWLGDSHLSHIFVDDSTVTGFIDIDSIRRNRRRGIRNFAKDFAGLNYPGLPMTDYEKGWLISYYLKVMGIKDRKEFLEAVKHYSERRWKA